MVKKRDAFFVRIALFMEHIGQRAVSNQNGLVKGLRKYSLVKMLLLVSRVCGCYNLNLSFDLSRNSHEVGSVINPMY